MKRRKLKDQSKKRKFTPTYRPSIPPLLLAGLVFWFGTLVAQAEFCLGIVLLVAGLLVALCLVILRRVLNSPLAVPLLCVLALTFGFACGLIQDSYLDSERNTLLENKQLDQAFGYVLSDSSKTAYGSQCLANVSCSGKVYKLVLSYSDDMQLYFGDAFCLSGNLSLPEDTDYLDGKGAIAKLAVKQLEIKESSSLIAVLGSFRKRLIYSTEYSFDTGAKLILKGFPGAKVSSLDELLEIKIPGGISLGEIKSLILALAFGFRPNFSTTLIYGDFKLAGLAHLVAVSGAHLALVSGFMLSLLRKLGFSVRRTCLASSVFLLLYLFMVGIPISCLRAAVMAILSLLSSLSSRRASSLSSLGVVIALFVGIDPSCAGSVSFQLSVLATLGIALFAPWVSWFLSKLDVVPSFIKNSFAITLAATVPTLPLTINLFSQVPLVSPLANLIAGPVLSIAMGFCLVLLPLTLIPPLLNFVIILLSAFLGLFVIAVHCLVCLPFACIPLSLNDEAALILGIIVCVGWWLTWPAPTMPNTLIIASGACSFLLVFLFIAGGSRLIFHGDDLVMLDVGQGDAFLLESKGCNLLIDTGRSDSKLLQGLASEGVGHLDGVMITHCDDDHYGSLAALRGIVRVDTVFLAHGISNLDNPKAKEITDEALKLTGKEAQELDAGSNFSVGNFEFSVLSPSEVVDGGNQDSLIVEARITKGSKEWKILFCGDAESETLTMLSYKQGLDDIDVFKVGHHGSRVSVDDELLDCIKPELALVSVGAHNSYGHPTEEALSALKNAGAEILRSDQLGKVICSFESTCIKIKTVG